MTTESVGLLYMLTNAGPVVKFIMLLLLFFSIISWSIIFIKFRYVRNAFRDSADFTDVFWQCRTLADAFSKAKALRSSPLARIFIAAYMEAARTENKENLASKKNPGSTFQTMGSVKRTLNRAINVENRRLTQLISFLATAGNTAPFIGPVRYGVGYYEHLPGDRAFRVCQPCCSGSRYFRGPGGHCSRSLPWPFHRLLHITILMTAYGY